MITVDYVYEFHIEWDRTNQIKKIKEAELNKSIKEEEEKTKLYLSSLSTSPSKRVMF